MRELMHTSQHTNSILWRQIGLLLEDGDAIQTPSGAHSDFDNDPGATVEEVDVEGNTPLHVAVEAGVLM